MEVCRIGELHWIRTGTPSADDQKAGLFFGEHPRGVGVKVCAGLVVMSDSRLEDVRCCKEEARRKEKRRKETQQSASEEVGD
ncbi:hypothetical protein NDU88_003915 [Pleurodeles waltl]|uniref:Uncharacterized protein n=1 Tax=Pleurodeles waltl TaxID=8319 RepID=A0AAV7QAD0_PLEWA|nr:hypothetical protein NDU88_003915 [Pleurodeles waltl]